MKKKNESNLFMRLDVSLFIHSFATADDVHAWDPYFDKIHIYFILPQMHILLES